MAAALILAKKQISLRFPKRGAGQQEIDGTIKGLGADFEAPDAEVDHQIPASSMKRRGVLFKMVVTSDIGWFPREVTITDQSIYISEVGHKKYLDFIPLLDVTRVSRFSGTHGLESKASRAGPSEPAEIPEALLRTSSGGRRGSQSARNKVNFRQLPRHKLDHGSNLEACVPGGVGKESPSWNNFENDSSFCFEICTEPEGHNSGRVYRFKANDHTEVDSWIATIDHCVKAANLACPAEAQVSSMEKLRNLMWRGYTQDASQMFVGGLIVLNFVASAVETELLPEENSWEQNAFDQVELAFTCVFTVELMVNLFVNWWRPFFSDAWSVFDGIVILASLAAIAFENIPGFNLFRLVRIFRVLRVFRRLASLRRIVNALSSSVLPMLNAFTVLFLITAIYAILAVKLYRQQAPVMFGSFSASFFTMFQVCTMDGWAEDVARTLSDDKSVSFTDGLFFMSFVVVVGIVILNVVVAVLLDEFVESVSKDRDERLEQRLREQQKHRASYGSPLDPVLAALAHFNTSEDLSKRIQTMFQMFDVDQSSMLSYNDLMCGLRQLAIHPKIHLSKEDFDIMTHGEGLLNGSGALGPAAFERVIRTELQRHVQRHLAQQMTSAAASGSQIAHVLFVLKLMMVHIDDLSRASLHTANLNAPSSHQSAGVHDRCLGQQNHRYGLPSLAEHDARAAAGSGSDARLVDSLAHAKLDHIIRMLGPDSASPFAGPSSGSVGTASSWRRPDPDRDDFSEGGDTLGGESVAEAALVHTDSVRSGASSLVGFRVDKSNAAWDLSRGKGTRKGAGRLVLRQAGFHARQLHARSFTLLSSRSPLSVELDCPHGSRKVLERARGGPGATEAGGEDDGDEDDGCNDKDARGEEHLNSNGSEHKGGGLGTVAVDKLERGVGVDGEAELDLIARQQAPSSAPSGSCIIPTPVQRPQAAWIGGGKQRRNRENMKGEATQFSVRGGGGASCRGGDVDKGTRAGYGRQGWERGQVQLRGGVSRAPGQGNGEAETQDGLELQRGGQSRRGRDEDSEGSVRADERGHEKRGGDSPLDLERSGRQAQAQVAGWGTASGDLRAQTPTVTALWSPMDVVPRRGHGGQQGEYDSEAGSGGEDVGRTNSEMSLPGTGRLQPIALRQRERELLPSVLHKQEPSSYVRNLDREPDRDRRGEPTLSRGNARIASAQADVAAPIDKKGDRGMTKEPESEQTLAHSRAQTQDRLMVKTTQPREKRQHNLARGRKARRERGDRSGERE